MKDYTLFAMSKLLQHCDARAVLEQNVAYLFIARAKRPVPIILC